MNNYVDKYVKFIVKMGINIQQNQKLVITCPIECAEFGRKIIEEAYKSGARDVFVRWIDDQASRIRYLNAPDEVFDTYPAWVKLMLNSLSKEGSAFCFIAADDPEVLKGVDQDRIMRALKIARKSQREYRERTMTNQVQWNIVSIPTEAWAKKVFPEETAAKAVDKLWDAIYAASHIDEKDPVENWQKHIAEIRKNVKKLNDYNFKSLHYKNSTGTDAVIELADGHIWHGAGDITKSGIDFLPNVPTEEVFTAPKRTGVNGTVVGTKPLVYMGDIIDGFTVEFKNGRAIKVTAKKNQKLLEKLVTSAPNANYLGEVALVPYDSPISKSGILFYNTLFDENASCHLAFGKAYPDTVKGAFGKKDSELIKMGVNCSMEHEDFMIGSADLDIMGTTHDGKEIPVFRKGNFAF